MARELELQFQTDNCIRHFMTLMELRPFKLQGFPGSNGRLSTGKAWADWRLIERSVLIDTAYLEFNDIRDLKDRAHRAGGSVPDFG